MISHDIPNIYFTRAEVRKELGDMQGAIGDYDKAIATDKNYTDTLYNRAYSYKLIGNYTSALNDTNSLIEINPDNPENWNLKGGIQLLFGNYFDAEESYSKTIDIFGDYSEAYYNIGLTRLMTYRPYTGCDDLQKCLDYIQAEKIFINFCGN